jgi:hypothetical protein
MSDYANIDTVMAQMKEAWKDYPEMVYRVVVEAYDPNVGRMDARYAEGYQTRVEQADG